MKLLSLFFLCLIVCLIIGSSSLRISNHQGLSNEQVRNEFLNSINHERGISAGQQLEPLVLDATLNSLDEVWSTRSKLNIEHTPINLVDDIGVIYVEPYYLNGKIYTFITYASSFGQAWQRLNQTSQWRKLILDKEVTRLGAALGRDRYYVISFSKVRSDKVQQDELSLFLQSTKESIMAQNPTVTNEDLDLSNRIAEWIKKGKPMGSVLGYFNSISYKPGEKVGLKVFKGSWKSSFDRIIKKNYFKMDNSARFTKFGIAAEINAEGDTTINVVFAG